MITNYTFYFFHLEAAFKPDRLKGTKMGIV